MLHSRCQADRQQRSQLPGEDGQIGQADFATLGVGLVLLSIPLTTSNPRTRMSEEGAIMTGRHVCPGCVRIYRMVQEYLEVLIPGQRNKISLPYLPVLPR